VTADRPVDRVGEEIAVQARDRDAVDFLGDERLEISLPQPIPPLGRAMTRAARCRLAFGADFA
jgi:hypothetical protein